MLGFLEGIRYIGMVSGALADLPLPFLQSCTDSEPDGEPIEPTLKVLNTNLVGCIYTSKLALHYLTRQPNPEKHDRCLILMSSIAGYCDQPGTPIYCASKHGIRGIMSSLRRTAHKQDVRVNLLAPW